MSLHSIIEPAGTLLTGWALVPETRKKAADIRNKEEASPVPDEGERPVPHSDMAPD
jgi:hypothetical protein